MLIIFPSVSQGSEVSYLKISLGPITLNTLLHIKSTLKSNKVSDTISSANKSSSEFF